MFFHFSRGWRRDLHWSWWHHNRNRNYGWRMVERIWPWWALWIVSSQLCGVTGFCPWGGWGGLYRPPMEKPCPPTRGSLRAWKEKFQKKKITIISTFKTFIDFWFLLLCRKNAMLSTDHFIEACQIFFPTLNLQFVIRQCMWRILIWYLFLVQCKEISVHYCTLS